MLHALKKTFFGRKKSQAFFRRLFYISLEGMNIGMGGGDLKNTGEAFAIRHVLKNKINPIVFDVGAQGGDYFSEVLKVTTNTARVHAFEPRSKDYRILEKEFGSKITLVNSALGENVGETILYFPDGVSGLSSLHKGDERFTMSESVHIDTIDQYCHKMGIKKIDLLKLDVEGHELACLKGAKHMLPFISSIQFEISIADRDSRVYFKDIFELLSDYTIYRILKDGLQEIKTPDKISELLFTTNYLAERKVL